MYWYFPVPQGWAVGRDDGGPEPTQICLCEDEDAARLIAEYLDNGKTLCGAHFNCDGCGDRIWYSEDLRDSAENEDHVICPACHAKQRPLLDRALDAFWDVVAREHPDAKTGDLSPLTAAALVNVARAAITEWATTNCP